MLSKSITLFEQFSKIFMTYKIIWSINTDYTEFDNVMLPL